MLIIPRRIGQQRCARGKETDRGMEGGSGLGAQSGGEVQSRQCKLSCPIIASPHPWAAQVQVIDQIEESRARRVLAPLREPKLPQLEVIGLTSFGIEGGVDRLLHALVQELKDSAGIAGRAAALWW